MESGFNFEKAFSVPTIAMYINRLHPSIKRNLFWVFQFVIIASIPVTSFLILTNSLLFYDIPGGKFTDASKNANMAIVSFLITMKYIYLLCYRSAIKELIDFVNKDYDSAQDFENEEKEIVITYSKKGTKVINYWLVPAIITSVIFPMKAFYQMGVSYWDEEFEFVPMFDMRYPERLNNLKDTPAVFWGLFSFCFLFTIFASSMYVGFDPLVPIFLLHICGQLNLLSKRIMEVFSDDSSSEEVNEKLKQINMKLQDIYSIMDNIKNKINIIYEFTMKTTTFLIPLSMFQVVDDLRRQSLNLEFVSFFLASLVHFYMPCDFSDLLMDESENLRKAIYSCGWERHADPKARKTILIMLTRTSVPLALSTIFYPVCRDTFAEVCRQSYTIFNIMNAAWA